jgi:selenocysteine lyase/cysteine desulfurase
MVIVVSGCGLMMRAKPSSGSGSAGGLLRIGFCQYSTAGEVERLLEALEAL